MGVEGLLQAPRAFARVCPSSGRDGRADVEESAARRRHTCPQDAFDVGTGGWAIAPCLGLFPGSVSVAAFLTEKPKETGKSNIAWRFSAHRAAALKLLDNQSIPD